jgi:ABC-type phosphate/phosphonate transport system permease subunit
MASFEGLQIEVDVGAAGVGQRLRHGFALVRDNLSLHEHLGAGPWATSLAETILLLLLFIAAVWYVNWAKHWFEWRQKPYAHFSHSSSKGRKQY